MFWHPEFAHNEMSKRRLPALPTVGLCTGQWIGHATPDGVEGFWSHKATSTANLRLIGHSIRHEVDVVPN